jgi:hypothetical protein
MSVKVLLGVVCWASINLIGCSNRIEAQQLSGRYETRFESGSAALILRPDGSFQQEISVDGQKRSAQGRWSFNAETQRLLLENGLELTSTTHGAPRNLVSMPVTMMFGKIEFEADPDAALTYRKVR